MDTVYIRADGNEIIATGHIMRCLSIAEQMRNLGIKVVFVLADERPRLMIEKRGFSVDVLNTKWDDLSTETEIVCDYVRKNQVKILLLDTYYVTRDYLCELSQYTKVIYIDDLCSFAYPVYTLVNYNVFGSVDLYQKKYEEESVNEPLFLVGGEYIPLRSEFSYIPYVVRQDVEKVLITTGGTDQLNIAGNLLRRIIKNNECSKLEYHIVVGAFNQNRNSLYELAKSYSNMIIIHENETNMSALMRDCDIAVSAGGTTLLELCACGVPTVCLEIADNQRGAKRWEEKEIILYAGNACDELESCIESCVESIIKYKNSYSLRKKSSKKMQNLVDGNGAKRIAEYVTRI